MSDCIFCKIVNGEIPCKKVVETDDVLAFEDIAPQAPIHILVIPKRHLGSVVELAQEGETLQSALLDTAVKIAKDKGLTGDGFRLVFNHGPDGGQAVDHVHLHLLAGRRLGWPPG